MSREQYKDLWSKARLVEFWKKHARKSKARGDVTSEGADRKLAEQLERDFVKRLFFSPDIYAHFIRALEWNEGQRNKLGGAR